MNESEREPLAHAVQRVQVVSTAAAAAEAEAEAEARAGAIGKASSPARGHGKTSNVALLSRRRQQPALIKGRIHSKVGSHVQRQLDLRLISF